MLKDLYRTKYPVAEELTPLPGCHLPLKTHKTSWLSAQDAQWLGESVGAPAHFMAASGGIGAACLVHCEMYGLPAY